MLPSSHLCHEDLRCRGCTCSSVAKLCMLTGTELPSSTWMRSAFFASWLICARRLVVAEDAFTLQCNHVLYTSSSALPCSHGCSAVQQGKDF